MERVRLSKPSKKGWHTGMDIKPDPGLDGWIKKIAWKNYWRVSSWYEIDDLIQDGYVVFCKCQRAYKSQVEKTLVEDHRCFMAFFKRAYFNHISDLARERTNSVSEVNFVELEDTNVPAWVENLPEAEATTISTLIAQAPAEIARMLEQLQSDGCELLKTRLRHKLLEGGVLRVKRGKRKLVETVEECWTRVTGRPDAFDVIKNYLID